jgi:eukaryotic-like serine/threonine-protein kinase
MRDLLLNSGTNVGLYEVIAPLGAGGMGEVYRARDTKLGREVALKVLPDAVAADAQRTGRFEREARVLASLNHPNIAAIYGFEDSGGVRALVMELVEGQTLAERIRGFVASGFSPAGSGLNASAAQPRHGSPIPLDEALAIAKQICEALDYAHERGIVHRDLKPANVKITPDGTVKLLDFGLAKALEDDGAPAGEPATSPTLSHLATQAGIILGTAAYMAPEQAKGKRVDRRADIWAFGCVLYEMLAGKPTFDGETASDVLAAVIMKDPDWAALPKSIPASIGQLLRRCIEKDSRRRLQAIGEARITIEEAMGDVKGASAAAPYGQETEAATASAAVSRPLPQRTLPWAAVVSLLVALAAIGGWWFRGRGATAPPRWSGELLGGSSVALGPRISPDGRTLAFQAMVDNQTQLAVMNPDSGNWTVLTHDRSNGTLEEICWSPDGSKLYFDRVSSLPLGIYTVPSLGGDERLVLKDAAGPEVLPDGSLLVWRVDPQRKPRIYHFWPDSGRLQPMDGWTLPATPVNMVRVFPDGKEAVFFGTAGGTDASPHLYALDIASGKSRRLAPQLPIVLPSDGFPVAVTSNNRSVLIDLPSGDLHQIVAIPRAGSGPAQVLLTLTSSPWVMDAAPDGSVYVDQVDRPLQVLRFPVSGGTPELLATSVVRSAYFSSPVEFPDGRLLLPTFVSGRSQLLIGKPGGNFFPLVDIPEETNLPAALLPDNQVAFVVGTGPNQTIGIASVSEGRIIHRLNGPKGSSPAMLAASPDGKTLYYTAQGSLWAVPAADGTPRKISSGDGVAVDPNGKDLIVNLVESSGVRLERIPLSGGPAQDVQVQGGIPLDPLPLGGRSIRADGKLLVGTTPVNSWFFTPATLDLASGKLTIVPVNFTGDTFMYSWTDDGRILAFAEPMQSHLWRFRPSH